MYRNLHLNNQGDFNISAPYWSSTEEIADYAWLFLFNLGYASGGLKNNTLYVRAVRAF